MSTLAIMDGNAGLATALREPWPSLPTQPCTAHKLGTAKAPVWQPEEVAEDSRLVVYAETTALVQQRRTSLVKQRRLECPAVEQLRKAGDEQFTFVHFRRSPWKALRMADAPERVIKELRRRAKTHATQGAKDAALLLLFGLLRAGHIRIRNLDGWQYMPQVTAAAVAA